MSNRRLEIAAKLFYRTILTQIINLDLKEISAEKLTPVQLYCMYYVFVHGEPSVGSVADGLAVSDAAAVKLIDRLVRKDLLIREEDRSDRRILKIKLTEQGRVLVGKYTAKQSEIFDEIIARMTQEARTSLEIGLTGFLEAALLKPEQIEEICLKCGWEHIPECPGNVRYMELTGKQKEKV